MKIRDIIFEGGREEDRIAKDIKAMLAKRQGNASKSQSERPAPKDPHADKSMTWKKGFADGKAGRMDPKASDAYGPKIGEYEAGYAAGSKMQGEGLGEGGFFDPDKPNIGDMVKHRNGAVGKVKKIGTQGDETHVYFRDQNGEMNYGQWKKHVFPMKESNGLEENIDLKHRFKPGTYKHREENITVKINTDKTVSFKQPAQWEIETDQEYLEYVEGLLADPKGWHSVASEAATAGATSSCMVTVGPVAGFKADKSYTGSPGKSGTKAPKQAQVKQPKKKNGTAVNALDLNVGLMSGQGAIKR